MADAVEALVAKQEITEQLHRYCHGLDRFDREQADIWHPGGKASYAGLFDGTGQEFLDWVWPLHEGFEATSHQVTNILIELDGPDRATSETYVTVCLRSPEAVIVDRGRYSDTWSRRDGAWGIDERRFTGDIQQILPKGDQ